jgi:hypothetical protein
MLLEIVNADDEQQLLEERVQLRLVNHSVPGGTPASISLQVRKLAGTVITKWLEVLWVSHSQQYGLSPESLNVLGLHSSYLFLTDRHQDAIEALLSAAIYHDLNLREDLVNRIGETKMRYLDEFLKLLRENH